MPRSNAPISLADLSAAGVRLRPYEAVTLVRELALQVARGEVAGVPSSHVIRLAASGLVSVEGPVEAGGRPVYRAAQLLESLMPDADAGGHFRVPGGLKLVIARALGTLDLPAFPSLEAFAEALGRFAATDPAATITNLVVSWTEVTAGRTLEAPVSSQPASAQVEAFVPTRLLEARAHLARDPLTVSDIRRARRATGLPLAQVSERSRIPVGLLRQLEWGYLVNWPHGHYGRTQLIRYARATGLDEQLVVSTIEPLIEQVDRGALAIATQPSAPVPFERREEPFIDVELTSAPLLLPAPAGPERRRRAAVLASLAVPAMVAIGLIPAWWAYSARRQAAPVAAAQTAAAAGSSTTPAAAPRAVEPGARANTPPDRVVERPAATSEPPTVAAERQPKIVAAAHRGDDTASAFGSGDAAFSPSFASVGTAVFYHAKESDRSPLLRADTGSDGSVLRITRIVDDTANNFHVRPSPDGQRIAFDSDRDGVRGVYVADADGKHVRRVSREGYAAVPSWSPDGSMLAFVRAEADRPKVWNLWTLSLATGEMQQLTRNKVGQPWGGSWFPDGRRIAYSHELQLHIRDLDTGRERVFETPRKGRLVRTPAVSPDGRRIVFQVQHDGVWLLELRDGSMRRVLEDPTAEEYTWSPDGQRVAYHSRKSGAWGVWVMAPR